MRGVPLCGVVVETVEILERHAGEDEERDDLGGETCQHDINACLLGRIGF